MGYADYKREWEAARAEAPSPSRKGRDSHKVTGRDLVAELRLLARLTRDPRFTAACEALKEHGLIDEAETWVRRWRPDPNRDASSIYVEVIEHFQERGMSLREACAAIVADGMLEHASFDAGVAALERMYRRAKAGACDSI